MIACLRVRSYIPVIYQVKLPGPCTYRRFSMASESSTASHLVQSTSAPTTINPPDARIGSSRSSKKDKKGASDTPKAPLEVSDDSHYVRLFSLTHLPQLDPPPDYIAHRIKMWDEVKALYEAFVASEYLHHCSTGCHDRHMVLQNSPANQSRLPYQMAANDLAPAGRPVLQSSPKRSRPASHKESSLRRQGSPSITQLAAAHPSCGDLGYMLGEWRTLGSRKTTRKFR